MQHNRFIDRHIAPNTDQKEAMLRSLELENLEALVHETVPEKIMLDSPLQLDKEMSEAELLAHLQSVGAQNKVFKSFIGIGYHECITPPVIQRNILENPGWYTAYTPYQAEIAQGRLEALANFQTMIIDLTAMEIANASLLDEATAAAEAMSLLFAARPRSKKVANTFLVDRQVFPQTLAVLKTRAKGLGIELKVSDYSAFSLDDGSVFGLLVQYPNAVGNIEDYHELFQKANENEVSIATVADILSLTILKPPGEMGADVVVGSTQRLGVPMGFGGPHAAYFATKEKYKRQIPGRIIGVTQGKFGNKGYRMALQTREQHIKRERATSNICTAQVLLAVIAAMYTVYHGPSGLKSIAKQIHKLTQTLAIALSHRKIEVINQHFFDTIFVHAGQALMEQIKNIAEAKGHNYYYDFDQSRIGISLNETTSLKDVRCILEIFDLALGKKGETIEEITIQNGNEYNFQPNLIRSTNYLTHPVFHQYRHEHALLRYLKQLENKDLSLVHSMIALGSCTMKLNATAEMAPISWPSFSNIHPFAPDNQHMGYSFIIKKLANWLNEITGFAATSFQPNSGAQGEYAGLLVIRAFHESRGDTNRNIVLIPSSAHGTNPASAIMAGMKVVIVKCDEHGNIDLQDLELKALEHKENLAALMVTYPSTHGVFEETIQDICAIVHRCGGQIYMDGANMNAQVGLTNPARIGADVCHLNLHKTFCIPHGGGGPGMGPICVASHLAPFLPSHPFAESTGQEIGSIAAAQWSSANILLISYAYIAMMGAEGLTEASKTAILNANYIMHKLSAHYPILYTGKNNRCAHEFILDCRAFKKFGVEVEDIAKRLMDYGYHAPTVSFPVPGTMMIEPTESEDMHELDRFCAALIQIRAEIHEVEKEIYPQDNNVLKNAPHTAEILVNDQWEFPYSREKAAYPLPYLRNHKFWPVVGRLDNAYGDRNLFCSCIPMEQLNEKNDEELVLDN